MQFQERAFDIQNKYNEACGRTTSPHNRLNTLRVTQKNYLTEMREKYKQQVNSLLQLCETYQEEPENLESDHNIRLERRLAIMIEDLSTVCTQNMIALAGVITKAAVDVMGKESPCGYAAVALGSMARLEATPYADLAFLFLVEAKTDENEAYFEHLAVNVYFLIGNLQETNLKYINIEELEGWFQDEAKSGFKIVDGLRANAGNIPTGNGSTNDKNIYICTVTSLLERYEQIYNNPPEEDNSYFSGDDSDMLSYVRLITVLHGNGQELFAQLQEGIHSVSQNSLRLHMLKLTFDKDQDKYLAYGTTFN